MTAQLSFPVCCLPGCKAIVAEWGDACATCQNDFGAYLVRVERDPDAPGIGYQRGIASKILASRQHATAVNPTGHVYAETLF